MRKIIILPILIGFFVLTGCTANNGSYEECLESCCVNNGQKYSDGRCYLKFSEIEISFDKSCSNICIEKYK